MKKYYKTFSLALLLFISASSFLYINNVEIESSVSNIEFEEFNKSKDKLVGSVKAATVLMDRVLDLLATHENS